MGRWGWPWGWGGNCHRDAVGQQAYARDVALTPLFFLLVGIGLFVYGANRRMVARTELPSYSGGLPAVRSNANTGKLPMRVGAASTAVGVFLRSSRHLKRQNDTVGN